jgi:hypothetical protein
MGGMTTCTSCLDVSGTLTTVSILTTAGITRTCLNRRIHTSGMFFLGFLVCGMHLRENRQTNAYLNTFHTQGQKIRNRSIASLTFNTIGLATTKVAQMTLLELTGATSFTTFVFVG